MKTNHPPTSSNDTSSAVATAKKAEGALAAVMQTLNDKWNELSGRDQIALIVLSLFLLLFVGGYGGHAMHQTAKAQKESYLTAVGEYFWLRDQAANIAPATNGEQEMPPDQSIMQLLTQMGATDPQVLNSGETLQISFSHNNQTAASNVLGAVVNSGLSIEQLSMQQDPDSQVITVQAIVSQ